MKIKSLLLVSLFCSVVVFPVVYGTGETTPTNPPPPRKTPGQNSKAEDTLNPNHIRVQREERRLGPFKVNGMMFTVVLKLQKLPGAPAGDDETVESFSLIDQDGRIHYKKAFKVEMRGERFAETVGVSGYALESCNRKYFRHESGKLIEDVLKGCVNRGLLLYYSKDPSAPATGVWCQVFTLKEKENSLVPVFPPLTVYGRIYELPQGSQSNARRLFDGDIMKFGIWTGWFEVIVPLKVLIPLSYQLITSGPQEFEVQVERMAIPLEETFVRLFEQPGSTIPRHVVVRKDTKVEFLGAYGSVSIKSGEAESAIGFDDPPWLKVRIDGKEGFVKDEEDLLALGIQPAG